MKLTLLNSGLDVEVSLPGEKKGRARMIQAFKREKAACGTVALTPPVQHRHGTFLRQLSATDAGAQVSTAAGRNDNPEPIDTAPGMSSDDLAKLVYGECADDIVGLEVRKKLRRLVSRQLNEQWLVDEKAGRHNRGAAEQQKFRDSIEAGTEAAVKAYARLRLGNPVDLQVAIAGSRANPVNG